MQKSQGNFMQGKFITIDGVEGAGKSTQSDLIYQYLADKGECPLFASFLQMSHWT
jgi:thymidylate kinase